ncbi:MAG: hypothetical protein QNJ29_02035 [Rhizobiaceae bacterium]|nr:hypothetical protein [Rhizobiaceae bacterium]
MTASAALQKRAFDTTVQTEDFNGDPVVANNDPHSVPKSENQVEAVRSRIKAARLEHLMARQLETDLAIELSVAPQLEADIMEAMTATTQQCETVIEEYAPYTQEVNEQKAFRENREECQSLVSRFRSQTTVLQDMLDTSGGLLAFISSLEKEFINAELARKELREAQIELKSLRVSNRDQEATLEKQTRQLSVLEALQESMSENFADAKSTIADLREKNDRANQHLKEARGEVAALLEANSGLTRENREMKSRLGDASETIMTMQESLVEKETRLAESSEKISLISQESEMERGAFSELKSKYERLNVKSLEYQGQHLSRITELEETAQSLKDDLDVTRREKESLGSELDAVNKLLMLHDEMLDALSNQATERSRH